MKRHTEKSTKHWFSIYQLVQRYLEEQRMDARTGTNTVECVLIELNDQLRDQIVVFGTVNKAFFTWLSENS